MMDLTEYTEYYTLFPTLVQSTLHPEADRINPPLLEEIYRLYQMTPDGRDERSSSSAFTTMWSLNDLHKRSVFKELSEFIKSELNIFAKEQSIKLSNNGPIIKEMWFNIINDFQCFDIHAHSNCLFTGVYYLKASKDSSPLVLKSENIDKMLICSTDAKNDYNTVSHEITPAPGLLTLFNANVRHSTWAILHKEERVSISFTAVV